MKFKGITALIIIRLFMKAVTDLHLQSSRLGCQDSSSAFKLKERKLGDLNILSTSQVSTMLCEVYKYTLGTVYRLT